MLVVKKVLEIDRSLSMKELICKHTDILKIMHCLIGSQWSFARHALALSHFVCLSTKRAHMFLDSLHSIYGLCLVVHIGTALQ